MAPDLVGMLAAGALKVAAGKVAEAAGDRIMLQWRFGEHLEGMQRTMESIQAVLKDAERMSPEDEPTKLWLERLTQASYDISDMFDEFELKRTSKLSAFRKVPMATKLKKVRETLDEIWDQRQRYSNTPTSRSYSDQQVVTPPEVIETSEIVGRDEEKQEILDLLSRESTTSNFIVLPIYGMGGIGKTTLADLIFKDPYFNDFEKAWVYVSQAFDLKRIKEVVTSQLELIQGQLVNKQEQEAGGSAPKSILIVFDDLWEKNDFKLGDMKSFLKKVGNGHKVHVIVTTRDASIAEKVKTIEAHNIHALSDDMCWNIIKQNAGFEQKADKERFEFIGKEIAKKCGGAALAARAIGYILRSMDFLDWVSVKDSVLWKKSSLEYSPYDDVLASLKFSYTSMSQHLRPCFAYCAIFPKGHKMTRDELIYQWAALGFIKPYDEFSAWQHGEYYIKQLLEMSFLSKSQSGHREDLTLFTMHDLVHDLARSIMEDQVLDASEKSKYGGSKCRYVLLADSSKPLNSFVTCPDKIRAIRFLGGAGHFHAGFSTAKYLRTLDLGKCSLKELPSSIGQFILLRCLNAPGITDREIPRSLTKLSKLQYLNLSGSGDLLELPESIGEMEGLMCLNLSGCDKIKMLPATFGKLRNLVHLDLCDCSELKATPGALCSLTKLEHLNLSRCYNLLKESHEVIGEFTELRYLLLKGSLRHYRRWEGGISSFFNKISTLTNLEHLDLSSNDYFDILPDSLCSLRKLHTLNLSYCYGLRKLPENMDNLKFLINDYCLKLDRSNLKANKNVIPLPKFEVHASERSSNLIRLKDVSPRELMICCLENAKSEEEGRGIRLRDKQSLEYLKLHWSVSTKRFVEDMDLLSELVPPSGLKKFTLCGYNSVSFPAWLEGIGICLWNLIDVRLDQLSFCSNLPPLGQLPNLKKLNLSCMPRITKIDKDFCGDGMMKAFTQLQELEIDDMENLEEWSTTYSCGGGCADEFMFPNLKMLRLINCHKLKLSPCPPRVRDTWVIDCCDGVLSKWGECSPQDAICSTSTDLVGTLQVSFCKEPMHQWKLLYHLRGLHGLEIESCDDLSLSNSPEVIGVLATLQSLYFDNIQAPPQWLGDCVCIKRLDIWRCQWDSFPENIQFKNLESLTVWTSPAIREWIKLEENRAKIGHIKEIKIEYIP